MELPVVSGDQTTTLAWFAELAYEDSWTTAEVLGWHMVDGWEIGVSDSLLTDGHYKYLNGDAMVLSAKFNGSDVLVMSFRGSEDNADWVTNITDIDEHFELFGALTSAAQAQLASGAIDAILVTGHSLGGAMTEVYLHTYADPNVYGISWGSPGIHMDQPVADSRLINYVFTDDGVAWLGTQRDEVGDEVSLWSLGDFAKVLDSLNISVAAGGFSFLAALADLKGDYQHQGTTAFIAADGSHVGSYDPGITLDNFQPYVDTHDMGRYLLASESLNPNPFSLPDSTVTAATLSANEESVLKLYDTVFGTQPAAETFDAYTAYLDGGALQLEAAAAMLNGTGLRTLERDDFIDALYQNVLGRDATWAEKNAILHTYGNAYHANVVASLANSGLQDDAMAPTINLANALGGYEFI